MGLNQLIQEKRREILEIAARHGAYNVRMFGSVARGEADEASDEVARILQRASDDLEDLLACKVDVVTERGLKNRIRDRVLQEAVPL